jgi:hypothetical protein
MKQAKEYLLNTLLAALVLASIALSMRIWFSADIPGTNRTKQAEVQSPPPSESSSSPEVYRPERIYVSHKDGQVAMLTSGSTPYLRLWNGVEAAILDMRAMTAPVPDETQPDPESDSITVVLPVSRTLGDWALRWKWSSIGLRSYLKVDRVTIYLDKTAMIHVAGTSGAYRVGPISESDVKMLRDLVAELEPSLFVKYRPVTLKDPAIKVAQGLLVPEISEMPAATLEVKKPNLDAERARYFPDLSVVRQIEEKDANSFTDGVRLLRILTDGRLEYSMAPPLGAPPDLTDTLGVFLEKWVGSHGGWSQDLLMSGFFQQPGRSTIMYDLRMDGVFPIESASPSAMRLEITRENGTGNLVVTQFRRMPDFVAHFGRSHTVIMTAEKALQVLAARSPLLLQSEEVREMHLAYLINQSDLANPNRDWLLEPVWVVQVGEKRAYVPAFPLSPMKPFVSGP